MTEILEDGEPITLTSDEVLLLRVRASLAADEESPFGPLEKNPDAGRLDRAGKSLAERGLAEPKTMRPNREVVRRMLIVAQPDSRIVLLRAGPGQGERLLDLYQRAGAFVRYDRHGDRHRFGPPVEFVDVLDSIVHYFAPRRSSGDFVDFTLDPAEHFAFSVLATEVAARNREGSGVARLGRRPPERHDSTLYDGSMDGAIILPGRRVARVAPNLGSGTPRAVPTEAAWNGALASLEVKSVVHRVGDEWELRPYFHDLAIGLLSQRRHVLTRFDFGGEEWIVRDATFVPVQGSVFSLRPTRDGGLSVKELDQTRFAEAVERAVSEITSGDTLEEL